MPKRAALLLVDGMARGKILVICSPCGARATLVASPNRSGRADDRFKSYLTGGIFKPIDQLRASHGLQRCAVIVPTASQVALSSRECETLAES